MREMILGITARKVSKCGVISGPYLETFHAVILKIKNANIITKITIDPNLLEVYSVT